MRSMVEGHHRFTVRISEALGCAYPSTTLRVVPLPVPGRIASQARPVITLGSTQPLV